MQWTATFQVLLETLVIQSLFSRPRVNNDNTYSEAMFRTLKHRPEFPHKGCASLEDARKCTSQFVTWYNEIHMHSGLNFVTPIQYHKGTYRDALANRMTVYETTKNKHPERWARDIKDWPPHEQVALKPMQEEVKSVLND